MGTFDFLKQTTGRFISKLFFTVMACGMLAALPSAALAIDKPEILSLTLGTVTSKAASFHFTLTADADVYQMIRLQSSPAPDKDEMFDHKSDIWYSNVQLAANGWNTGTHSVLLTPDTEYTYYIYAENSAGGIKEIQSLDFITTALSNDATLLSLFISGQGFYYGAGTQAGTPTNPILHNATVTNDVASFSTSDVGYVLKFDATAEVYTDPGYSAQGTVNLSVGSNNHLYIIVTAEDCVTTLYYDITITRDPPASTGPVLSDIGLSGTPTAKYASIHYSLSESAAVYFMVRTQTSTAPTADEIKAGTNAVWGAVFPNLNAGNGMGISPSNLTPGTAYTLYIYAENNMGNSGIHSCDFSTQAGSNDATIKYIAITGHPQQNITAGSEAGTLAAPKTASITVENSVTVLNNIYPGGNMSINAAAGALQYLYIDPAFNHSGYATDINLSVGSNNHLYVKTVAEDEVTTLYYDITVTRKASAASSDASLISVAGQSITAIGTGSKATPKTASITVANSKATIEISDIESAVNSDKALHSNNAFSTTVNSINLNVGSNNVYISVIAEDATTTIYYNITVTREAPAASNDASLISVAGQNINATGTGTKASPKTASITVANSKAALVITDIVSAQYSNKNFHPDNTFTSSVGSANLNVGSNNVYISVIAEDNTTTLYYNITVIREAAAVVTPTTYSVNIGSFTGGSVSANNTSVEDGQTVTLTISPDTGYELDDISVNNDGSLSTITMQGTGNTRTFTMPDNNVTVTATFKKTALQSAWEAAQIIIENAVFNVTQENANTEPAIKQYLATNINNLVTATGFVVSASDISITNFKAATAISTRSAADANGSFEFSVTPQNVNGAAVNNGTIIATNTTDTEAIPQKAELKAWAQNGIIYVSGLTPGKLWHIYRLTGAVVYSGIAVDEKAEIDLPGQGLYIVTDRNRTIKVFAK